jgi:hypothetical protein
MKISMKSGRRCCCLDRQRRVSRFSLEEKGMVYGCTRGLLSWCCCACVAGVAVCGLSLCCVHAAQEGRACCAREERRYFSRGMLRLRRSNGYSVSCLLCPLSYFSSKTWRGHDGASMTWLSVCRVCPSIHYSAFRISSGRRESFFSIQSVCWPCLVIDGEERKLISR